MVSCNNVDSSPRSPNVSVCLSVCVSHLLDFWLLTFDFWTFHFQLSDFRLLDFGLWTFGLLTFGLWTFGLSKDFWRTSEGQNLLSRSPQVFETCFFNRQCFIIVTNLWFLFYINNLKIVPPVSDLCFKSQWLISVGQWTSGWFVTLTQQLSAKMAGTVLLAWSDSLRLATIPCRPLSLSLLFSEACDQRTMQQQSGAESSNCTQQQHQNNCWKVQQTSSKCSESSIKAINLRTGTSFLEMYEIFICLAGLVVDVVVAFLDNLSSFLDKFLCWSID